MQHFSRLIAVVLISSVTLSPIAQAEKRDTNLSVYRYHVGDSSPRSVVVPPILSLLIPGFDQWIEGQYDYGLGYSIAGISGFLLHQVSSPNVDRRYQNFGLQIYLSAGAMSLFHSFRSAANTRRPSGDFKYLKKDESPAELFGSAIKFSYIGRWSTLLPLISGMAAFFLLDSSSGAQLPAEFGDFFYAGTTSYMTGISEEIFFRGYLMPMLYHYSQNDTFAILAQGGLYGLAHGLRFRHFITATLFGMYAGWIVQKQDWELSEMIFVHTWLDLMSFLADYANHREPSALSIPLVMMRF